jgi:S1-C subfamily serine protease
LNVLGELIGVNTAIRGDAQNIGFAIPVDHLHELLPSMLDVERLRRVELGVHFDSRPVRTRPAGVRIRTVDAGSRAGEIGLREGDVVVAIDGKPTPDFMDAFSVLAAAPEETTLKIEIVRDGGDRRSIDLPMARMRVADAAESLARFFGIRVRELDRAELRRLGLRRALGLMVEDVQSGSEAAGAGMEAGDLITMFGGWPVTSLSALGHLMQQVEHGDRIPFQLLRIRRDGWTRFELGLRAQ